MIDAFTLEEFTKEEMIDNIKKVTKNDIIKVSKKLKLESVYFLEGDKKWLNTK